MLAHIKDIDRTIIVCPRCKTPLDWSAGVCRCSSCSRDFEQHETGIWDFTFESVETDVRHRWRHGQDEYEEWARRLPDDYDTFMREIDSVEEIYRDEFPLSGRILDVGGLDGRLRHFLRESSGYMIVDPFPEAIVAAPLRLNLTRAYPELLQPAMFVCGVGEALPVADGTFDVVHIRSALDHFADPLAALSEARRVLVTGGRLLVGLHVTGGRSSLPEVHGLRGLIARARKKVRDEGIAATAAAVLRHVTFAAPKDEHMWHPTYDALLALLSTAGFEMEKEHWQKPPNDHVVYIMSRKLN